MLKIYNRNEFLNRIQSLDEIILFGAGKKIYDVEKFFAGTEMEDKVSLVLDNNKNKQGTQIRIWGRNFEIFSCRKLEKNYPKNRLVLLTLEEYGPLLDDLLAYEAFQNIEIVCFSHISALLKESRSINKTLPSQIRIEKEPLIPKKIHYCWFGGKPMPDKYKRYMESWYKYCPDYEIIEWNESNYDLSKCRYMEDAFRKKIWGFVPDYARIDIVYHHGGIYMDTDVELIRNIDDLLYQKGFAGFEDEGYVNLGSGFGAVKELPVLKAMMEYYDKEDFIGRDGRLNLIGSPVHNTSVLQKHGLVNNGDYQKVADMTIYPAKVLTGKCMYTMRTVIRPWTYAVHHYDGSWATERARRINARLEQDMKLYHPEEDGGRSV